MVPVLMKDYLPSELQDFQVRGPMHRLMGIYYGSDPNIHYEAWLQPHGGLIELGLHFESDAATNARGLAALQRRAADIIDALGHEVEAGPWTKGWTRVHEVHPLEPMGPEFADKVARRLSSFIVVLEPLVRELGLRPE